DNKTIFICDDDTSHKVTDVELIGGYNVDEASVSINTQEQKTYIRGFGKKKTKSETKNYNPIKPPNLTYNGTIVKEGTWYTERVGNSFTKRLNCKWGNETLAWTIKKSSLGGMVRVYLDNAIIGNYNSYSRTTRTEQIIIARNLSKGNHTIKVEFVGP